MPDSPRPTNIRARIIGVTMLVAFIMYLDRNCMGEIVKSASFKGTFGFTKADTKWILFGFYFSYALFQIPAGWASDRFGARAMLTIYTVLWSLFTIMTGLAGGFAALLAARLLCGMAEAGAYPTAMAMIRKWIPLTGRARASGSVALGGRIGGTVAPFLTIWMIVNMGGWRPSLWLDGAAGLLIAFLFWKMVRANPQSHPGVNAAELALIGTPQTEAALSGREFRHALRCFSKSTSLWCNSAYQFLVNIGWGFLVTWLPTYLKDVHHVEEVEGGKMVTCVLAFGMLGQLAGGIFCDRATRRFGIRKGRVLPVVTAMILCTAAYACCPFAKTTWLFIACCAAVSFCVDLANPAMWAFIGDVGGRATAAAGGWGNMWGNLGAASGVLLVPWLEKVGGIESKSLVFFTLAGAFALAGLVVLPMNATKKLIPDESLNADPA